MAQAAAAALLFLLNLTGPVAFAADPAHNTGYIALREIRRQLQPGDVFAAARRDSIPDIGALMPYFFPELRGGSLEGRLFAFQERTLEDFQHSLELHLSKRHGVYLLDDFFNPGTQAEIEKNYALKPGELGQVLSNFSAKEAFHLSDERPVFQLALRKKN